MVESHKTVEKSRQKERGHCWDITVKFFIYISTQAKDLIPNRSHFLPFPSTWTFLSFLFFLVLLLHLLLLANFNNRMSPFSSFPLFFLLSLIQEIYDSWSFFVLYVYICYKRCRLKRWNSSTQKHHNRCFSCLMQLGFSNIVFQSKKENFYSRTEASQQKWVLGFLGCLHYFPCVFSSVQVLRLVLKY